MLPQNKALLEEYGMDVERTLARFSGNEALMLRFLRELETDECLPAMLAARASGDDAAFQANAHALKGLAGSLGLAPLYARCSALMDALRANDAPAREKLYPLVLAEFDRAARLIARLEDQ